LVKRLAFVNEELDALRQQGFYNNIRTIAGKTGTWLVVDGRRVLNLCANNYLGFATREELKVAARKAIDEYGVGPGATRPIAGTQDLDVELEETLARFKGGEACLVLQGGFVANTAVIPTITGEGDVIFSDELNHASIIDGCRLSKAKVVRYSHNNCADLRAKLQAEKAQARRMLIVTDGVFSMDGDIAPLPDIVRTADESGALVMVDDAHGEGVLGQSGRGIVNHFGLEGKVHIEVGTLSKAFGVMGGFVVGCKGLIDLLKQRGRPFVFGTGLTPADKAAAIAAVNVLLASDAPVRALWGNTRYFQGGLRKIGFDLSGTQTPITPVILGKEEVATEFSKTLLSRGIFVQAMKYPIVAKGKARVRCMLSAQHTKEDLDFALQTFSEVGKDMGILA
jgi:glycine C-acetyltransferase